MPKRLVVKTSPSRPSAARLLDEDGELRDIRSDSTVALAAEAKQALNAGDQKALQGGMARLAAENERAMPSSRRRWRRRRAGAARRSSARDQDFRREALPRAIAAGLFAFGGAGV
jgi:hypothetical protein